jgi:hypothetical protein
MLCHWYRVREEGIVEVGVMRRMVLKLRAGVTVSGFIHLVECTRLHE